MDALTLYAVKENLMIRISSNNLIKDMCIRVLSIPLFDDGAFSFIHATSEFTKQYLHRLKLLLKLLFLLVDYH